MNIPIYRAKEINSNEYIKGTGTTDFLNINNISGFEHYNDGTRLWLWSNYFWIEIDPTTLAIHFEDMFDSQGNKIFASLSEDGKGGDILQEASRLMCNLKIDDSSFREFTAIHTINGNRFVNEKILSDVGNYKDKHFKGFDILIYDFFMMKKRNIKVIGIQE